MHKISQKGIILLLLVSLSGIFPACAQNRSTNINQLFEALQLNEGRWMADIGSREGFFSIRMATIVGDSGHVFAVDIDADALEDLHENIADRDLTNITPIYSVNGNPMLPANLFDAILVRNAYHEFDQLISMLRHIKDALKAGGRLVIAEPIDDDLIDADRDEQARSHDISINYVKDDLNQAGFTITRETTQYSTNRRGDRLWLIVAQ